MAVKSGAFVKLQGILEAVDGKIEYAAHILLYIAQRVGSNDGYFAFGKRVFLNNKMTDGDAVCKNTADRKDRQAKDERYFFHS